MTPLPAETTADLYTLLADGILLLHFGFVLFVVSGLLLVAVGGWRCWRWIHNGWFRLAHLAAIGVVTAQAWLGRNCPLTVLEMWLRRQAGQAGFEGSFVEYWVGKLLYYNAPPGLFIAAYSLFAILVLAAWFLVPPHLPWRRSHPHR